MNWREFDIHGLATVRVARDAPTEALMSEMFAPFASKDLTRFDVTVTSGTTRMASAAFAEDRYRYTQDELYIRKSGVQIRLTDGCFHLSGKGELLTAVLPLLDIVLARRGVAMIHAASIEHRGRGIALAAWGGTGKTSALAELSRRRGASFMGDDWAFVSSGGRLLGFAKPLFIKPHHRAVYPDLFDGRRKLLVPSHLSGAVAQLSTAVHPLVTKFPRVAAFSRRWSPEYLMVDPSRAFDNVKHSAQLGAAVFIERFTGARSVLEQVDTSWMAGRLIGNFYAEMSRQSRDILTALGATGIIPLPEPFAAKHKVLADVLSDKPAFLLRVPRHLGTQRAACEIADGVMEAASAGTD